MRRLVIAIDCDDVLINATKYIVDTYNKRFETKVAYIHAHDSKNLEWSAGRDEVFHRLHDIQLTEEFKAINPREDATQVLAQLSKYHDLHLITARSDEIATVTEAMIDTHFSGHFVSINHVGSDRSKGEVCAEINADVMIDDNIRHLDDAAQYGVPHLIWFGDYSWQSNQKGASKELVLRCKDWHEVEVKIDGIAKQQ